MQHSARTRKQRRVLLGKFAKPVAAEINILGGN